jgi:hypothetical protein
MHERLHRTSLAEGAEQLIYPCFHFSIKNADYLVVQYGTQDAQKAVSPCDLLSPVTIEPWRLGRKNG